MSQHSFSNGIAPRQIEALCSARKRYSDHCARSGGYAPLALKAMRGPTIVSAAPSEGAGQGEALVHQREHDANADPQ